MNTSVVVLTCDRYKPYWEGFWRFMEKQWDFGIDAPIYFCNEENRSEAPPWCRRILTGGGTFVQNLRRAVEKVGEDEIFLMLEDFWPIAPMGKSLFNSLNRCFRDSGWDALQVSNYTPYYRAKRTDMEAEGKPILEFDPASEWIFNFQARFWKTDALLECLTEPEVSEKAVGSAITVEMASDQRARESGRIRAGLCHYLWYPMSGVAYRGQLTDFGRHLQNIVEVDRFVDEMLNSQGA